MTRRGGAHCQEVGINIGCSVSGLGLYQRFGKELVVRSR